MKFSIIIPTYLHLEDCLRPCLESIVKFTDLSTVEVLVVANGCGNDGTREYVESLGEPFKLIWLDEPSGYTHSVNVGIEAAQGEYLVLLNNDTVLLQQPLNEWLDILLLPFTVHEKMAATGPIKQHCPSSQREFLIFFCVMISRKAIDELGALDEVFSPGYGEDTDFCLRAVDAGWQIAQAPEGVAALVDKGCDDLPEWKRLKMWTANFPIYHDGNKTFGSDPSYEGLITRNSKILEERYGPKVNTPDGTCNCGAILMDGICVYCAEKNDGLKLWRAAVIDGWFGVDEGAWIAQQVKLLPPNSKVLSVGAWHGRSSRFIADNLSEGSQLWDIDTWNGSSGEPDAHLSAAQREGDHAYSWYWCNLHEHIMAGRVVPMRIHSANGAETLGHLIGKGEMEKFDLIFIDGDHSEEGIKTDVNAWLPFLKQGGLICGHDYYKEHEGPYWVFVREFVEDKFPGVQKTATSIWYTRPHAAQGPSMVYDCFLINNELDLLELRFNELNDVVDRWVITEAPLSHGGNPKPCYFQDSVEREPERWAKWINKVTHIIVDDYDQVKDLQGPELHWAIERHQRDALMRGLSECQDSDIVLISDVDEIPRAEALKDYSIDKGLCALEMKLYYGSMNCEGLEPWRWTRILPYSRLKEMTPCGVRYVPNYDAETQVIKNAGWHFSFMGGPDEWVNKLEATPHQEYNKPEFKDKEVMKQRVLNGQDLLGRDIPYRTVEVDETFPKFVVENLQRFTENQFIMHPEANHFVETVKQEFPEFFKGKKVLEVGSLDINGSVRQYFEDCDYEGIDIAEGNGVDRVVLAHQFLRPEVYDVVISSEMLEHDKFWFTSLKQMWRNLKQGGLFVLTCAGPNRPEHGTTKTDTYSSPFTTDYYRNISTEDFNTALPLNEMWADAELEYGRNGEDLYFRGIKKGPYRPPQREEVEVPVVIEQPSNVIDFKQPESLAHKKHWSVTASVSTKDRYQTTLPLCLSAIINQTHKPDKLKVYDDGAQENLFELSPFNGVLRMAQDKGIDVEVLSTPRKGQVSNHQHCLDNADTDFVWRVDDDEIPEPNCLEVLLNTVRDYGKGGDFESIGAVAGLVHHPANVSPLPVNLSGSLSDINHGNIQWHQWNSGPREVEHLYSTFLYRTEAARKAGGYPKDLSPIGHREESIFSHSIQRAGYKVLVTPHTKTWHLRESSGGIRSFSDTKLWEHDEQIFQSYLQAWNINLADTKLVVLDLGLGDHLIFKGIFPELKRKFPDRKWTLSLCYPEVFKDEDAAIISIADAKLLLGHQYDSHSVYKYCWDGGFERPMPEVMLEFFSK